MKSKFGKYQIKSELGRGAMGVVYLAEDSRLGRPVALKTMSPNVAGDPELLKRFYREAQSAGNLRHPNIVTIYDIDEAEGTPFIAMEFLEGESLEKIIEARKDLPVVKKLEIIIQVCRGLHYAHEHGIVHRDVKPANIVLLSDGLVKIVDFGIARIGATNMTRTGVVMGTPMYMSPEQIQGQPVDARSDIFSVGVILYELLTFQNPFSGSDVPTILYKILNEPPLNIIRKAPECPPELEQIIQRAVAKNREQRYQSSEDLAFDLQHVADSLQRSMLDLYVQQGQRSLQEGNLTLAKESFQKALEIDSGHDLAKDLLDQVQEKIYDRQRGQKVEEFMRHAQEALRAEQYDEAVAALEEILRLEPRHEAAQKYKQQAAARREFLREIGHHLERAQQFLGHADFKSAESELKAVLALDPKHTAALKMMDGLLKELAKAERLRQVGQHIETARARLAEKNFVQAIEFLETSRDLDPLNIEVETLMRQARSGQEQEERRRTLDQRLAEIQEALGRENFDQALASADKALQEFPGEAHLLKLHSEAVRLADTQKKGRRVDEQLKSARDFVQKNQYAEAMTVLERALETAPGDSRLTSFLKTVQEAQADASREALCRQAIREANKLIRDKDLPAAIATLEGALAAAGHSSELDALLKYAREQLDEFERQERIQQVLNRAQASLRAEDFEEVTRLLQQGQAELKASEIDALLATARDRQQEFQQRRADTLQRARQLLQGGEPTKAVAALDAAPRAYFKDPEFQSFYARCREAASRSTFIRNTVGEIEKLLLSEDPARAMPLLQGALQVCPDDPKLLALRKKLAEEKDRMRRGQWARLLDEAKVAIGRMEYKEAIRLLGSVPWDSTAVPELAKEAKALLQEAQRGAEGAAARTVAYHTVPTAAPLPRKDPLTPPSSGQVQAPTRPRPISVPVPAPAPSEAKRTPFAFWGAMSVIVVTLFGVAAWRFSVRGAASTGRVQLSAAPWAEVVSVRTADGRSLGVSGQTPVELVLPPGNYVVELKNERGVGKVDVVVESGKASAINYTFPDVNINEMVDDLVSKY